MFGFFSSFQQLFGRHSFSLNFSVLFGMDDVRVATEQARAEGYAWSRDANATSITCPTAVYLQNCGPRQASAPTKPTTQQANNALEPSPAVFHMHARVHVRASAPLLAVSALWIARTGPFDVPQLQSCSNCME
jgi:hypothetical protein